MLQPHRPECYSAVRVLPPRLYVRNFWSQEKRLPRATLERMLQVLHSLYCCQIERSFLSLATNLLLEMTSQSPDFTRNMFEYPLSECTFQVRSVSRSLVHLHADTLTGIVALRHLYNYSSQHHTLVVLVMISLFDLFLPCWLCLVHTTRFSARLSSPKSGGSQPSARRAWVVKCEQFKTLADGSPTAPE